MPLAPGDILSRAVVEGQDILGRWWFNAGGLRGNIPGKYASTGLTSGQVLNEVVYFGNGEFAIERYEGRLIRQFYYLGHQVSQEAARVETWVSRWQEVAAQPA